MERQNTYNFSAGPSMMPEPALRRAAAEMENFGGTGMSVMEMSHRSPMFADIFDSVKAKLISALDVPDTHGVLFLQGGATLQFAMAPMNLMGEGGTADYAVTGNFSSSAAKEAAKYGKVRIAASTEDSGHAAIPAQSGLELNSGASYFYYCANNTIYGTEWQYVPETGRVPIVCDMSSNILSKPVDVSKYGLIFAGAQKNMAPAGLTIVMIDKSLAGHELLYTPSMMSYALMLKGDSMYNTPPCYNIYMLGLVLDWLEERGGVRTMEEIKRGKAALVYDLLDGSSLFKGRAGREHRSDMNVTFSTGDTELDRRFVREAEGRGLYNLAGHRVTGGMRASIYNAMPVEGVAALVEFMKEFELNNR